MKKIVKCVATVVTLSIGVSVDSRVREKCVTESHQQHVERMRSTLCKSSAARVSIMRRGTYYYSNLINGD